MRKTTTQKQSADVGYGKHEHRASRQNLQTTRGKISSSPDSRSQSNDDSRRRSLLRRRPKTSRKHRSLTHPSPRKPPLPTKLVNSKAFLFFKPMCSNLDVLFEILQKLSETMCLIHNYSSKLIHVQMNGNKLYVYTKTQYDKFFFLQKIIPLFYSKHRLKTWLVY